MEGALSVSRQLDWSTVVLPEDFFRVHRSIHWVELCGRTGGHGQAHTLNPAMEKNWAT